jgi:Plasmid recombination enzyme
MAHYAIMRLAKVKTLGHVAGLGRHIERERETPNADSERTSLNERLAGTGDWSADVQARLDVAPTIRKNAVLSIEMMLAASPEWFNAGTEAEQDRLRDAWRDLSVAWLRETFGEANVVAAMLHRDESTPHIQALIVPIDERGRLNARRFIGGDRHRLTELQDSYATRLEALGLERGIRGSVAEHQEVKRWYAQSQEVSRDVTQQIATAVEIEAPPTVVARPREYARQQHDRVVASVAPRMEALAQRAEQLEFKVERQELQIAAQAEREQMSKALLAHLRQVNLGTVMTALGAEPDRSGDLQRWHLNGEVISIKGERFHCLTRQRGGTGALELVMHAHPTYDFEDAVVFLGRRVGPDIAVVAAARYAQGIAERAMAKVPARELEQPPPPPNPRPKELTYER